MEKINLIFMITLLLLIGCNEKVTNIEKNTENQNSKIVQNNSIDIKNDHNSNNVEIINNLDKQDEIKIVPCKMEEELINLSAKENCCVGFKNKNVHSNGIHIYAYCSKELNAKEDNSVTNKNISSCSINKDCLIVPYNHCCGSTKRAINKKYLDEYNAHPEWQKFNDVQACSIIGQCPDDSNINKTECKNGMCNLNYN
mgnify:CR=1 FL=1|jgi:hypothetical protein